VIGPPFHRGEEVTDEMIDRPQSMVFDEVVSCAEDNIEVVYGSIES
jgi:ornithine carbamoyltransferase